MKITLVQLTVLVAIVASNAYAHDEPSVALRGSESMRVKDEISKDDTALADSGDEYVGVGADQCVGTGALSSSARHGMTKGQVCRRDHMSTGQTIPYKCSKSPGYACCKSSAGSSIETVWGTCKKSTEDEDSGDEYVDIGADQCVGTGALSSSARHGMTKGQVCRRDHMSTGQTIPYKCSKSPGYACCNSSAGSRVSTVWGTCKKDTSSEEGDEIISIAEVE